MMNRARATAIVAAILGLFLATAVIGYFNFGAVLKAIEPIGIGGFLAVILAQVALFVPLGLAWWLVSISNSHQAPLFMWARLMREAASDVLPFSQVGGIVISIRAVVLGGVSTAVTFGACVVDITFEIVAQLIYTLIGIALLVGHLGLGGHNHSLTYPLVSGVVITALVITGLIATRRQGLGFMERMVQRLAPSVAPQATGISQVIEAAYARPLRLLACLAFHVLSWFGSSAGTWLILWFIGRPLPYLSVVALESLLSAIRNAAFLVPGGLGVQEGAYALLGPMFGVPVEAALALSLLKRGRDIAIGVPMLMSWQVVESRKSLKTS